MSRRSAVVPSARLAPTGSIDGLRDACRAEAIHAPFPVETEVYEAAGRDPMEPILYGGSPGSELCFFGRDLGKEEVVAGEPLKGAAGRLVREAIYRCAGGDGEPTEAQLQGCARQVLLANTVPYKPPGNKAYTGAVKDRFRPFITELLVRYFDGHQVITLGNEAFLWFSPCGPEVEAFWAQGESRYEATLEVTLRGAGRDKRLVLAPLPHPSPLNATYYKRIPQMLASRLKQLGARFTLPAP